jgi:amino acid permease
MLEEEKKLLINYDEIEVNVEVKKESKRNAGVLLSIFNLANGSIGAGILAFPYCFYQTGLSLGIFSTLLFAVLSGIGLVILSNFAMENESETYQGLIKTKFGNKVSIICELILVFYLVKINK